MKVTISDADGGVRLQAVYEHDYTQRSRTHVVRVPITSSRDAALAEAIEAMFAHESDHASAALATELHGDLAKPTTHQETTP